MESAIIQQHLDFFQDFLHLCQQENWPENETTEQEIKNAFLCAVHIEKSLDRLQKKEIINEFLSVLSSYEEKSKLFLKNCLGDPPKYVLKKIVVSNTKTALIDVGFKVFLEMFSEEKLENCLTDFMVEAASAETLLKNLPKEISKENLQYFKTQLLLLQLTKAENPNEIVLDLLENCTQDKIDIIVVSLLSKDIKYMDTINKIIKSLTKIMLRKNQTDKLFWKYLFKVKDDNFIKMCLDHDQLFKLISSALFDSGKLIKEHLSAEYFYIDLNYSELSVIVQKICGNENLQLEFFDMIRENHASDVEFWENLLS